MEESNVNIMLDTVRRNRISVIYAVENDYGARFITAAIMTDGKKKAVKKTAAVTINAERPDGQRKAFEGSVNEDGTVKVPVTQWMLEFEGEVVCSVSVVTSTSRLTTTHFYIQAQYSVWDGTSAPSADDPNKDVIVSIIAAENERVANENARISTENTRKTAETARIDAENIRIAKESVRVSNEAERVSAETVRKTEFAGWQGEIGKISAFDKRIENLEAAVSPGLVTPTVDDSVAYSKDVPIGALPNAMISEVGGMTRKCMNLITYPYSETSKTTNGITFTINADGSIIVNGTATADARIFLKAYSYTDNIKLVKGETYTLSGYPVTGIGLGMIQIQDISYSEDYVNEGYAKTFTAQHESYYMVVKILEGKTVSNLVVYPTLNKGDTTLPYEPYFEGLRDAKVTAVESVGVNLFDKDNALAVNGYFQSDGAILGSANAKSIYIRCHPNTIYTISKVASQRFAVGFSDLLPAVGVILSATKINNVGTSITITSPSNAKYLVVFLYNSNADTLSIEEIFTSLIIRVGEDTQYIPYVKHTISIPEAVQALEGYGQGVSKEYHNKIVLDPVSGVKKFVRNVGMVDLGTLEWRLQDSNRFLSNNLPKASKAYGAGVVSVGVNAKYMANTWANVNSLSVDKTFALNNTSVYIADTSYTDVESFKAAMQGVMLVYELATPIETDLSDYFGDDNLIGVEGGGTVTMVNEYEYDVPSVIEYTVKGVDAI